MTLCLMRVDVRERKPTCSMLPVSPLRRRSSHTRFKFRHQRTACVFVLDLMPGSRSVVVEAVSPE